MRKLRDKNLEFVSDICMKLMLVHTVKQLEITK